MTPLIELAPVERMVERRMLFMKKEPGENNAVDELRLDCSAAIEDI